MTASDAIYLQLIHIFYKTFKVICPNFSLRDSRRNNGFHQSSGFMLKHYIERIAIYGHSMPSFLFMKKLCKKHQLHMNVRKNAETRWHLNESFIVSF